MVGTSAPSSTVQDEEEKVVYSCAIGVDSKTDDRKKSYLKRGIKSQTSLTLG